MGRPAHPHAMAPKKPGRTRAAPPQMPGTWWSAPRIRTYLLFDATGVVYLLAGLVALRLVWSLGEGPEVWGAAVESLSNPLYIAFHLIALISVLFVGVRFFRLFPKAQPRNLPVPPDAVILGTLYAVWIGVTILFSLILAGSLF